MLLIKLNMYIFNQFVFLINSKFPILYSLDNAEMNVLLQMKANSEKLFHKPSNWVWTIFLFEHKQKQLSYMHPTKSLIKDEYFFLLLTQVEIAFFEHERSFCSNF